MKPAGRIPPIFLFLSLLIVYGLTLAPGLTWANRGADGGDLIAAAATGGVPHPTGYPVYLWLARAFQFLPIGSLAFRTNLLSALAAAGASLVVYQLVSRSFLNPLAGLIAAYAFGLSPLLWSQAVITEVYALHAFFVALILYWSVFPPSSGKEETRFNSNATPSEVLDTNYANGRMLKHDVLKYDVLKYDMPRMVFEKIRVFAVFALRKYVVEKNTSNLAQGLTFGLALGNHLTTILLLPVLLASSLSRREKKWRLDVRSLLRRLAWLGAGLLAYLMLPLRAASHPPVNWGNPVTLKNFGWLVSARLYQDEVFALTLPSLWERLQSAAALLLDQFGIFGLVVALLGLILFFHPSPLVRNTLWTMAAFSVFAIGYATDDSFVYLIPPALCFAAWIGAGVDGLTGMIARRSKKLAWAAGLAFLLYLFVLAGGHWPQVDASRDARAEQFGELVMAQMPADTLVFVSGDQAIFSLWYFHYALRQRADLAVIAADLLQFDWYQDTLKSTYPSLVVPGPFPFPETILFANPGRPVCYVEYDGQALIQCP